MPRAVVAFPAMGTTCEVTVDAIAGAEALCDLAATRVALLEQCWSRFRPTSELSMLNARAGRGQVQVSGDLLVLVQTMQQAWERTDHRFDPTVLHAVRAAGYDADFAAVIAREALAGAVVNSREALAGAVVTDAGRGPDGQPAPGMSGIVVEGDFVALPAGVGLDPGAIGKGLAADLVAEEIMGAGATGVMVSLGGDIRFAGQPGDDPAWVVSVVDERLPRDSADRIMRWIAFDPGTASGAVATSTTLKRRWPIGSTGAMRHHVINPMTGEVADLDLVQATVVADEGWWAEAAATAALLLGPLQAPRWLQEQDLSYLLLDPTTVHESLIGVHHG